MLPWAHPSLPPKGISIGSAISAQLIMLATDIWVTDPNPNTDPTNPNTNHNPIYPNPNPNFTLYCRPNVCRPNGLSPKCSHTGYGHED